MPSSGRQLWKGRSHSKRSLPPYSTQMHMLSGFSPGSQPSAGHEQSVPAGTQHVEAHGAILLISAWPSRREYNDLALMFSQASAAFSSVQLS